MLHQMAQYASLDAPGSFSSRGTGRATERILRSRGKEMAEAPLRAKRAENFQGLEINFGKILLVYFMSPPDLEVLGIMRPFGT